MLKSLDVLIGFALVMLLASLAVTLLTQAMAAMLRLRGKHLLRGVASLVKQIDPALDAHAGTISTAVLTHPLVAQFNGKPGVVIQREELTRILLELAAGRAGSLEPRARAALMAGLQRAGIPDPAAALERIQMLALKLEAEQPALADHVRHTIAIVQGASSDYVARVNAWFDVTMDRVGQAFTFYTRRITIAASLLVAVGLQLDALDLLKRLSNDDKLREAFVAQAREAAARPDLPAPTYAELQQQLGQTGYAILPNGWNWDWNRAPGLLLSAMLLSLGAPFWYGALKNLVRLRPLLASKEEVQRQERGSWQPPPPPPPPRAAAAAG